MTNAEYWIWLQTALGYGSIKPFRIFEKFDTAKDFYESGIDGWKTCKYFSTKDITKLRDTSLERSYKVIEQCKRRQYDIITPEDASYPTRLMNIKNPPAVIYVKGQLPNIDDETVIAIVGTRKCSDLGNAIAQTISYRLSCCGAVIVSGGAMGCDIAATKGALKAKAKSIIVLGCGLSYPYLMQNSRYRSDVAENGAVITEFQPFEPASRYTFPVRNRLMSALSLGVMVVEAPERSGALITVEHALEQGKYIFTVPGAITSKRFLGNNRLLEDGAIPVFTPYDIISEFISEYSHKLNYENSRTLLGEDNMLLSLLDENSDVEQTEHKKQPKKKVEKKIENQPKAPQKTNNLIGLNAKIYSYFTNGAVNIDTIIEQSQIDSAEVLVAITELEIEGYIRPVGGGRYEQA